MAGLGIKVYCFGALGFEGFGFGKKHHSLMYKLSWGYYWQFKMVSNSSLMQGLFRGILLRMHN